MAVTVSSFGKQIGLRFITLAQPEDQTHPHVKMAE